MQLLVGCQNKDGSEGKGGKDSVRGRFSLAFDMEGGSQPDPTLTGENGTGYAVRFMPGYKYIDRTGKNPLAPDGGFPMRFGKSGLYVCTGKFKTFEQDKKETGRAVTHLESQQCFFDVETIELIEADN
jgi:hypothetical protein